MGKPPVPYRDEIGFGPNDPARFWSKVKVAESGCWEWQAGKLPQGYGQFAIGNHPHRAHVVSHAIATGRWPESGEFVCHHCDNPMCVRPSHLFLGTVQDNVRDMRNKGRHSSVEGEAHYKARLTESRVLHMRRLFESGVSIQVIADMYNVAHGTAHSAITGASWKFVKDELAA